MSAESAANTAFNAVATAVTSHTADQASHAVVAGAVTSPWWLPSLHQISSFSAEMLPILGMIWLVVQIGFKIFMARRRPRSLPEE